MLGLNKPVNIDRDRFFTEKEVTNKESREAKMNVAQDIKLHQEIWWGW